MYHDHENTWETYQIKFMKKNPESVGTCLKDLFAFYSVLPENVGTKFSTLGSYLKNIETNRGNKPIGKTKKS